MYFGREGSRVHIREVTTMELVDGFEREIQLHVLFVEMW